MPPALTYSPVWTWVQWGGILATAVLVAALLLAPDIALTMLWFVIIPILPATFIISPAIWRGVCPLATLNTLFNGLISRRMLRARWMAYVGTIGIILLFVMVPARHVLFNENGLVLAITIVVVGVAALVLGMIYTDKAGFCNAICPVLPVERLYGQGPLLDVGNPRCGECVLCTDKACLDLVPKRSVLIAMGPKRGSENWFLTPYGIFAAAFPGFVVGYFMTSDGPLSTIGDVYLTVFGWSAASWLLVVALSRLLRITSEMFVPALGAAAVLIYYWFSAPAIATEFSLPEPAGAAIRIMSWLLVGFWLWKKYYQTGTFRRSPRRA